MRICLRRREFIAALGQAAAWPVAAGAEQIDRLRRISVLMGLAENDPEVVPRIGAFEQALEKAGWVKGRNLQIEYRWAGGSAERMRAFAKELVGLHPDLIVTHTTLATVAAQQETRTIPIVFVQVSDPVVSGIVPSLARPGGNVTGFANFEISLVSKWVELLKEIVPSTTRIALLYNADTAPFTTYYVEPFEAAARAFSVQPIEATARDDGDIENAIKALVREPGSGLVVMPDIFTAVHRRTIIRLAGQYRVPAVYPFRYWVTDGGLISYGIDVPDLFRQTASYVDRILRGSTPRELAVQGPVKFELLINLRTASALGIEVPRLVRVRADEVIE
jgi:putative ABC transport system substrate-binding protein